MDVSIILQIVSFALQAKSILDTASSNEEIASTITKVLFSPSVIKFLEDIGSALFPMVASKFHATAALSALYDPNITKWVQNACNILTDSKLEVDGIYGVKTRDAVSVLQQKLGLTVDGWAGQVTQAVIGTALTKLGK